MASERTFSTGTFTRAGKGEYSLGIAYVSVLHGTAGPHYELVPAVRSKFVDTMLRFLFLGLLMLETFLCLVMLFRY